MHMQRDYSKDEVIHRLEDLINLVSNLDNNINDPVGSISEGDIDMETKRIKQRVAVNGQVRWIDGYSTQDLCENYVKLLVKEGVLEWVKEDETIPYFGDYLETYYRTYKQNQENNTVINRERIIQNHVLPAFGKTRMNRIRTTDIQLWLNKLGETYSKETILKIKNIMSPVFDAAVEDDFITKNPMSSKRITIPGRETVHHKAIPRDKMEQMKNTANLLPWKEKAMLGLLCYTGMRFEEVLGVRWEDISDEWIAVERAVVHPTRNQPEVKLPKTKTSVRRIPLHPELKTLLGNKKPHGFLLATDKDSSNETPLSYTEARRVFTKIRKHYDLQDYSAHDFRDTCATQWRENGMPLDVVARLLGHSKTETTEKRYVKYRDELLSEAKNMM